MMARIVVLAISFSVVLASLARADDQPEPTVRDVLAACDSTDAGIRREKCDREFGSLFQALIMGQMSYSPIGEQTCFPLRKYDDALVALHAFESAEIAWLHRQPQIQSHPFMGGTVAATIALYGCKSDTPSTP